jgi:hypothetical protein
MKERQIRSQFLRVGTQLLTPDGWQTITGMLAFQEDDQSADQVTIHTAEKTIDNSNGWGFRFGEMVTTRGKVQAENDCPTWCCEHYKAGDRLEKGNHASFPESVPVVEACTGTLREIGLWAERRTDEETGEVETFGMIELRTLEDVELPPERLRELARKLGELADLIEQTR